MINNKLYFTLTLFLPFIFIGYTFAELNYGLKTATELTFDREIEDVAFDSYEENGQTKFYPKVVVLREVDQDASKGTLVNHALEVRILDRKGKTLWRLPNLKYFSKIYFSKNGKFFGVYQEVYEKGEQWPSQDRKVTSSLFTVYNDQGEVCWQRNTGVYGLVYGSVVISPTNGSVFVSFTLQRWESYFHFFDSKGNSYPLLTNYQSTTGFMGISDNGEFAAFSCRNSALSTQNKAAIALINDSGKLVWERTPEESHNVLSISRNGSYIFTGGTILSQERVNKSDLIEKKIPPPMPKVVSSNGYIYNNQGDLIMKIPLSYVITQCATFSENEHYLLFTYTDYREYIEPPQDWLIVKNLINKEEFLRVPLQENIRRGIKTPFMISNSGEIAVICEKNFFLLNNKGELVGKEDIANLEKGSSFQGLLYEQIGTVRLVGWNDLSPIIGWIGHKDQKVKIITLEKK